MAVAAQARAGADIVASGKRTLLASDLAEKVPAVLDWFAREESNAGDAAERF